MKKKILMGIFVGAIAFCGGILWSSNRTEYNTVTTGISVVTGQGIIIVVDETPIKISNQSSNENLFMDLQTGDKVTMTHTDVSESYPAQTGVYKLLKIETDCMDEVPTKIITELTGMGYTVVE